MRRVANDTKAQALGRSPLFEGLTRRELTSLARVTEDLELPAGKVLCREGRWGQEFFVLVDGEVEVSRDGQTVRTLGPGDYIGEIALVEKVRRTATVTARTPVRVFVLTSQAFFGLLDANPVVERKVLRTLARRVL